MSRVLYYDASAGISGDMNLGALVALGVDFELLKSELKKLNLDEFRLERSEVFKCGIKCTKIDVIVTKADPHARNFKDIKNLIQSSNLSEFCKKRSLAMFEIIARAEAKIHGSSILDVHFHEVGAIDSIVDIVGAAICFEILDIKRIVSSKIELGGGTIRCDHGVLNVPAPAVCEILQNVPVSLGRADFEMTTPTGAAILKANTDEFAQKFNFTIQKIGYGAGSKDAPFANALRVMICKEADTKEFCQRLIQTNIDDMDSESFAFACEELLNAGALDVFSHSIYMKKGRIGLELNVLCKEADKERIKALIFRHTTAIGVRETEILKTELKRNFVTVSSKFGDIKLKISHLNDNQTRVKPEFEECKIAAKKFNVTLGTVKSEINKIYDETRKFKK